MKTKHIIIAITLTIVATSCNNVPSSGIETSLKLAGSNRKELEKVIEHYSAHPADSLKLKAVYFLIENMYVRYSYDTDFPRVAINELSDIKVFEEKEHKLDSLVTLYKIKFNKTTPDCQAIKADYLVENIEYAFKVWNEQPWGKHISFNTFCDYILPYKLGNEPLENWRKTAYELFNPLLDSVRQHNGSVLDAAWVINNYLIESEFPFTFKTGAVPFNMGFEFLHKVRMGYCRESVNYVTYIMRALGIPAGEDFVNPMANTGNNHSWNFVLDSALNTKAFDGMWRNIDAEFIHRKLSKKGKVFRYMYRIQQNTELMEISNTEKVPGFFKDPNIRDVSASYFKHNSILIPCANHDNKIAYLCVFNDTYWVPVTWGIRKDNTFIFNDMDYNVAFLPCINQNGKMVPIYYPVILDEANGIKVMKPDENIRQKLTLYRKFAVGENIYRVVYGKFQGSMDPDFKNAKEIYQITDAPEFLFNEVYIKNNNKYRFVRYLSPRLGHCNIAEIIFYNSINKPLKGKIIGVDCTWENAKDKTIDKVFDGNVFTYYNSCLPDSGWVGLDLGHVETISKIVYVPRNDDNYVKKGDLYELVYHNGKGWETLGKTLGDTTFIIYENAPTNALFLLHDRSGGREERIFTYDNGKIVWY